KDGAFGCFDFESAFTAELHRLQAEDVAGKSYPKSLGQMGPDFCLLDFAWSGLFRSVLSRPGEHRFARALALCPGAESGRLVSVRFALDPGALAGSPVSFRTASLAAPTDG